jgi:hypothetical protein
MEALEPGQRYVSGYLLETLGCVSTAGMTLQQWIT